MSNNMTSEQKIEMVGRRLAHIKSECHQAVHPTVIRDRLRDLIETFEWLLVGRISSAEPNLVPGVPYGSHEDPTKTRVEFFAGPGVAQQHPPAISDPFAAPAPAAVVPRGPVNNGDVNFIPGPPPGSGGGAVGGQTVEFYNGPTQRVDHFSATGQNPADARPPVSNQPQQIIATPPTLNTEAGHMVAPIPGQRAPAPHSLFPGFPPASEPPAGVPRSEEELRQRLPIPVA